MYDYTKQKIKHLEGNVNEIKMSDYIILPKKKRNIINFNDYLKKNLMMKKKIIYKIKLK